MRLGILADIHGNLPALEAVLADMQKVHSDGIIVAGDLGGGPQGAEVIRTLRSLEAWMVRGNTDNYLLAYDSGEAPLAWCESKQWAAMRWTYRQYDRETLDFTASLPEQAVVAPPGFPPVRILHGSPQDISGQLFPDRDPASLRLFRAAGLLPRDRDPPPLELALGQIDEPVVVCGHTHIPWKQEQDGRLAFNPGSVGGSIDGDVRAQYALLTWREDHWQVTHCAVPYDLDRVRVAFRASGLLANGEGFGRAQLLSIETGRNTVGFLVAYAYRLADAAGFENRDAVPDAIWDQAVTTFDWEGAANTGVAERRAADNQA